MWVKGPALAWVSGMLLAMGLLAALMDGVSKRHPGARLVVVCYPDRSEVLNRFTLDAGDIGMHEEQGGVLFDVGAVVHTSRRGVLFSTEVVAEHRMWITPKRKDTALEADQAARIRSDVAAWVAANRAVRGDAQLLLKPDGFSHVRWLPWGFAANAAMLLPCAGLWVGVRNMKAWRAARREETAAEKIDRGECPGCGYDIAGLRGGVCPECGTSIA